MKQRCTYERATGRLTLLLLHSMIAKYLLFSPSFLFFFCFYFDILIVFERRKVDVVCLNASDATTLWECMNSDANGIQVDFDDGYLFFLLYSFIFFYCLF